MTILSYAQYCRYIAMMKRLETVEDKWLKNIIACALGGFTVKYPDARILFCRDTIEEYEEINDLEIRCDHLGRCHYVVINDWLIIIAIAEMMYFGLL